MGGVYVGYILAIDLSAAPLSIVADGDGGKGTAMIFFAPPGLTNDGAAGAGACAQGTFHVTGTRVSTDENQADVTSTPAGDAIGGGGNTSAGGPFTYATTILYDAVFGFADAMIEPVMEDTGTWGPEVGGANRAASSGSGLLRIGARLVANQYADGSLCLAAVSTQRLPVPFPIFGAQLCLTPNGSFNVSLNVYGIVPLAGGEAMFATQPLPVGDYDLYQQGYVVTGFGPLVVDSTNCWRVAIQP